MAAALEPPSQKLLHTQAKANALSSDEYVKQGVLAGIDLNELLEPVCGGAG